MITNIFFQERVKCWNHTVQLLTTQVEEAPASTKFKYDKSFSFVKQHEKSNISFFDMDSIDCCLEHAPNALVLNLADDYCPGGSVDVGSGAQEESLFRRTNYSTTLKINMYPLKKNEVIYSPNVSVIKSNEKTGWQLLDLNNLQKIAFIACPGIRYPITVTENNEKRLNKNDAKTLANKIRTIIQTAIRFHHDTIIFGALGCGAWKNPAKDVAKIFKEVLQEYDGAIKNFYFAIMSTTSNNYTVHDHEKAPKQTIEIFQDVFLE